MQGGIHSGGFGNGDHVCKGMDDCYHGVVTPRGLDRGAEKGGI